MSVPATPVVDPTIPASTPATTRPGTSARRSTSRGRSPTSATSPASIASRRAGRARRSRTSSPTSRCSTSSPSSWTRDVPYLSFSGGEPMVHPRFFEMVEYACSRGAELKIETNGHYLTPENCERLKALGVKAVQVSLDGASRETFNRMRVLGEFNRRGGRHSQPSRRRRADRDQLLADALQRPRDRRRGGPRLRAGRVQLLHRPHDVHRQRGQDLAQDGAVRRAVRRLLRDASCEDRRVPRPHARPLPRDGAARGAALPAAPSGRAADPPSERAGQAHQCAAVRVRRPAAPVAAEIWANFQRAWRDPRVAKFVEELALDPGKTRTLHQWVHL